jgi:hypothetical protein
MARVVDGLAFRYYWATEGLTEEEMSFRPGPESMSMDQLLEHILGLVSRVDDRFGGEQRPEAPPATDVESLRGETLQHLAALGARLVDMDEDEIAADRGAPPFWNMISGPLSDALTHVGQVNAWRRLAGNPSPRANLFWGRPPEED